jgi:hypothetical protein
MRFSITESNLNARLDKARKQGALKELKKLKIKVLELTKFITWTDSIKPYYKMSKIKELDKIRNIISDRIKELEGEN